MQPALAHIMRIQDEWLTSAKTKAGAAAREALNIFSEFVFIEPGQFVLELLQNAEDARMRLGRRGGEFYIRLFTDRVEVRHDGDPFNEKDIESLCGIGSLKKPKEGYKGYIGIGWKSVFQVSNEVYLYSGDYSLKFDENYWRENERYLNEKYGLKPSEVPWRVTPIPIERDRYVLPDQTLIVVRLREHQILASISDYLARLGFHLFLFLSYINKIVIEDETRNYTKTVNWAYKDEETISDDVTLREVLLQEDSKSKSFLVFNKTIRDIPEHIRKDILTSRAKRSDVQSREVSIAFALDERGTPIPLDWPAFSGVYSFMPLPESTTGLKFLVQADFIVQPGRRAVNHEAIWNHWLMKCVADLLKVALNHLGAHYGTTYLQLFEYNPQPGPFYERLLKPTVVDLIDAELRDPVVPCIRGHKAPISRCVRFDEKFGQLISKGLLSEDDLEYVFAEKGLHLISPDVKLRQQDFSKVRRLAVEDLLSQPLLKAKLDKGPDKLATFLAELYRQVTYLNWLPPEKRFVITKAGKIVNAADAYLGEVPGEVKELADKYPDIKSFLDNLDYVHDLLVEKLTESRLKELGVKKLSFAEVCRRVLLPKIETKAVTPTRQDLVAICQILNQAGVYPEGDIWVVARGGSIRRSSEVYYPWEHLKPFELYERLGFAFLDLDEYGFNEIVWRQFFSRVVRGMNPCMTYHGYQFLSPDYRALIEKITELLRASNEKSALLDYTRALKKLWDVCRSCWDSRFVVNVVTVGEGIAKSDIAFLHSRYKPEEDWMKQVELLPVGPFVTDEYLDGDDPEGWRSFLIGVLCVKEKASKEQIEKFAEVYAERRLMEKHYRIVSKFGEGFDFEIEKDGKKYLVDVVGRRALEKITLSQKETKKAVELGEGYWVMVVVEIPNDPKIYIVRNPAIQIGWELVLSEDVIRHGELWV